MEPVELAQEFRKFEYNTPWETFPAFRDDDKNPRQIPPAAEATPPPPPASPPK